MKGEKNMTNVETVKTLIEDHNDKIDAFTLISLPHKLCREGYEVVNGCIPCEAWFAAQRIISEEHFWDKAAVLCSMLRAFGYDAKRDAQSNKLIWNGGMLV